MGAFGETLDSSDPFCGRLTTDQAVLQQWCEHTLQTKRGTLRTAPDHGFSPGDLLLQGLTPAARIGIPAMAKAALENGKRVDHADVELVEAQLGGGKVGISLAITVTPRGGAAGVSFTYPLGTVDDAAALAAHMIKGNT